MKYFKNQLNKNSLFILICLILILIIFYFSLQKLFAEFFLMQPHLHVQFFYFYLLFSTAVTLSFLASAVTAFRMIYVPFETVIQRLRNLRTQSTRSDEKDFFETLPDFWNEVEAEVSSVLDFYQRKNKQTDRIKKTIENVLNVFPEPSLVVSRDGILKYTNKSFLKMLGLEVLLPTLHISDLFREPQILALIEEADGANSASRKEFGITIQGHHRIFIVFKTPYATRNEDGEYDFLIIFHDITQIKKTDQMKTDFVSNVSHELRTPLMSIQGYMQTLKEDLQSGNKEHIQKYFEIIESHVERLSNLVGDLLELSYLESDMILQKTSIEPEIITQKILKQFSLDLEKGSYRVIPKYNPPSANLFAQERLVEQVLINLIQNCLRYTPHGTEIQIEWHSLETQTLLIFKDNGPGISREHLSRIFERFYRIDPHRSRSRGGTGLGLSIIKHILQRHNGTVEVISELGHGLEFKCVFPKLL